MKTFIFITTIFLITLLTGCYEETDIPEGPRIIFHDSSEHYITSNTSRPLYDSAIFKWKAFAGDAPLKTMSIKINNEYLTDARDSSIIWKSRSITNNKQVYIDSASYMLDDPDAFPYFIEFIITDEDGISGVKTLTIKEDPLLTSTNPIKLGGQNDSTGSFYDISGDSIYTTAILSTKKGFNNIDLVYYYSSSSGPMLYSPQAIVRNEMTWQDSIPLAEWGEDPNVTALKQVSQNDWDNTDRLSGAKTLISEAKADTAQLSSGNYWAFQTTDETIGLLHVTSINDNDGSGTITIEIKK